MFSLHVLLQLLLRGMLLRAQVTLHVDYYHGYYLAKLQASSLLCANIFPLVAGGKAKQVTTLQHSLQV